MIKKVRTLEIDNKKKRKIVLANIKKVVFQPGNLVILIILLIVNSFAWFIYAGKVQSSIDAHVRSWKVTFTSGSNLISDYFVVNASDIFPGMDEFNETVTAHNESEVPAALTYTIIEARIFDQTFITREGRRDKNQTPEAGDMTSDELEAYLLETYPFEIVFSTSTTELEALDGFADYTVTINWPFEGGNDTEDTYWGNYAATYSEENPGVSSLTFVVKLYIEQVEE